MGERYVDVGKVRSRSGSLRAGARAARRLAASAARPSQSPPPLFAEIGRIPHRDRFTSAPRSVEFRTEIGSLPHRDRSMGPAGRPQLLRNQSPPDRLRDGRGDRRRALPRRSTVAGAVKIGAILRFGGTAGWLGEMRRTITARGAAAPDESGACRAGTSNRSRHGSEPISARNWTDLGTEVNRSRAGSEPISAKGAAEGGAVSGLCGQGGQGGGDGRLGNVIWVLPRAPR